MEQQITFQVYHGEEQPFAFQQGLTLFFGLQGETQITCHSRVHTLEQAGLLAAEPFTLYRVSCDARAAVLALHIPRTLLGLAGWDEGRRCNCYVRRAEAGQEDYDQLRRLYATVFRDFFQDAAQNASQIASSAIQLAGLLAARFSAASEAQADRQREPAMQRLSRILDYIHDHWSEPLSLSDIAVREFLTVSYLSRFFQKHLHTTFTEYLTELRLSHAAQLLGASGDSVTKIAYACGFRNVSAFIGYFRGRYGVTPGQYRTARRKALSETTVGLSSTDVRENMEVLLAYAAPAPAQQARHAAQQITVRCDGAGQPLRNTWRRLMNIGYARDGLLADVREQIQRAQREIGFEFLRFHGLFDDDMKVYTEDENGNPHYNFTYVDLLFDFIRSQNLRAYVELSFLPPTLAREQTRIFDRATIISGCRDLEKWAGLVNTTLTHLIGRYGRETVREWRFTTVSVNYAFLCCMTIDEYLELYRTTFRTVKSVDARFCFGGPGGFANLVWEPEGFRRFIEFAAANDCVPDFFAVQCYPHRAAGRDPAFMDFTTSQQSAPTVLSSDESFMRTVRGQLEKLFSDTGLADRPIWFEECNSTLWQRDLSGDTCYKAVWLVKNICENFDRAEAFGYWLLTDFIDEHAVLGSVFHGGYGLFTYNGVPKSGYHAMRFLRRLGDCLVGAGDGWFLTRRGSDYQLLLYNYCHYDNLYRYRYRRLESPEEAYSVFQAGLVRHLHLTLQGVAEGTYRMETQTISRAYGSSFDKWVEIGAPEYLRPEELQYLAEVSQPSYQVRETRVVGELHLDETLQPLETRLLLLQRSDA